MRRWCGLSGAGTERSYRDAQIAWAFPLRRPMKKLVVAIGGNAILPAGDSGDAASQRRRIAETCARLADLAEAGYDLVVTHGNGPQVGNILLQNEESRQKVPAMPLDVCGAESQAQIGYMLQQALANEFAARGIRKDVASVITQVLVDADDPAFSNPTKPIGPYYAREDEIIVKRAKGWKMVFDSRGGGRRRHPRDSEGREARRGRGRDRQGPCIRGPREGHRLEDPRHRHGRRPGRTRLREADAALPRPTEPEGGEGAPRVGPVPSGEHGAEDPGGDRVPPGRGRAGGDHGHGAHRLRGRRQGGHASREEVTTEPSCAPRPFARRASGGGPWRKSLSPGGSRSSARTTSNSTSTRPRR